MGCKWFQVVTWTPGFHRPFSSFNPMCVAMSLWTYYADWPLTHVMSTHSDENVSFLSYHPLRLINHWRTSLSFFCCLNTRLPCFIWTLPAFLYLCGTQIFPCKISCATGFSYTRALFSMYSDLPCMEECLHGWASSQRGRSLVELLWLSMWQRHML